MLARSSRDRCWQFRTLAKVAAVLLGCGAIGNIASATISFLDPVNVPLPEGAGPEALAVGHFKGDQAWDLAVANGDLNSVSILLGNTDGTFQPGDNYDVGTFPWYVTAADLNGDGIPDLVVSNHDSSDLTVLIGMGDGSFFYMDSISIPDNPPNPNMPFSTVVADFNSDGFADIVVTNTSTTFLVLGNGDGTFGDPTELPFGSNTLFAALGDFNGDGVPDLAVTKDRGTDTVTIQLGNGDGSFYYVGDFAVG